MGDITIDVLLEFLYNRFAVTFLFCLFGSFVREVMRSKKKNNKNKKSKMLDIKRIVTSTMFSTFLMCACADYVDLPFSVYVLFSVFCGVWGIVITNILVSENFAIKFITKLCKKIASPVVKNAIIKSVIDSASETLKEQEKETEKEKADETENDNKDK